MTAHRPPARERRRDRRIPVAARVRMQGVAAGPSIQADLVDVSAGGLRAVCPAGEAPEPGAGMEVEITVQDAADARLPPLVNLSGSGRVLRISPDGAAGVHVALVFTGALSLREPFAQMLLF